MSSDKWPIIAAVGAAAAAAAAAAFGQVIVAAIQAGQQSGEVSWVQACILLSVTSGRDTTG